jgi:hypothetical protein
MRTTHFIVHPEFAIQSSNHQDVEEYAERIVQITQTEDAYVISSYCSPTPQNDFEFGMFGRLYGTQLVPKNRIFSSNGFFGDNNDYFPFGHVSNEYWEKFSSLVKQADNIKLHGSFMGKGSCLRNLAVQTFGIHGLSKHWFNWDDFSPSQLVQEDMIYVFLQLSRVIQRDSFVRYGVVFSDESLEMSKKPLVVPFGKSLDEQLCDSQTVILGRA